MKQSEIYIRRQRRRQVIKVNGKEWRVRDYLAYRAAKLPDIKDNRTGGTIDHVFNLKKLWVEKGDRGVNRYMKIVKAIWQRDRGKFAVRLWARVKLLYFEACK